MPFGRLHEEAAGDSKLLALSNAAWRMWGMGLIYCQKNLTDGFIPEGAIGLWGVREQKGQRTSEIAAELCRAQVPGKAPLWANVGGGYQVHDYLDWNDSKAEILEMRANAKQRIAAHRERRKNAEQTVLQHAERNALQNVLPHREQNAHDVVRGSGSDLQEKETRENSADDLARRAGRLRQELYPEWYAKWRNGARLRLISNTLEFHDALSLVQTWDDVRLEKLARIVLTTDDDWISRTDRGFKIFALKASWADDKLREWEEKQGKSA